MGDAVAVLLKQHQSNPTPTTMRLSLVLLVLGALPETTLAFQNFVPRPSRLINRERSTQRCPPFFATLQPQETTDTPTTTTISSSVLLHQSSSTPLLLLRDYFSLALYTTACVVTACLFCVYQDYECSHLQKTQQHPHAVRGMGFGTSERSSSDLYVISTSIPSYNEVLLQHRTYRVPMWKAAAAESEQHQLFQQKNNEAVQHVRAAFDATLELQRLASDYAWDDMRILLRQPVLTTQLDEACAWLRANPTPPIRASSQVLSASDISAEIGFEWGSCAWRHCGAHADAQEALAEVYNYLGVFEPYECLFCLDIVERSLRDILAVCSNDGSNPDSIRKTKLPEYRPYQPVGEALGGDASSIDLDFLDVLKGLRNNLD